MPATIEPVTTEIEASGAIPAPLSLRTNFSWTFAGSAFFAVCQWGTVVAYAKLSNPEELGRFALGISIAGPAILFSNLSLRSVVCTDANEEFEFQDYLRLRLICTGAALTGLAAFLCWSGFSRATIGVILAVALAKALESVSDIFYGLLQQRERMDRIAHSLMLRGALAVTAVSVTVALTRSAFWGSLALAAAWLAPLAFFDIPGAAGFLRRKPLPLNAARLCRLAWIALPLGAVDGLISLSTNVPRYFILRQLGTPALGIFSALTYFTFAGTTAVNALGQSACPRLARYFAQGDRRAFGRLLAWLLGVAGVAGIVGVLLARFCGFRVLEILYARQYAEQTPVLVWLMAATLAGYLVSMAGYAMTSARVFSLQVPIFAISIAVIAGGCLLWIPSHGALGAAWAMGAGAVASLPLMLVCVWQALR